MFIEGGVGSRTRFARREDGARCAAARRIGHEPSTDILRFVRLGKSQSDRDYEE